jgi:hypothetical protein
VRFRHGVFVQRVMDQHHDRFGNSIALARQPVEQPPEHDVDDRRERR